MKEVKKYIPHTLSVLISVLLAIGAILKSPEAQNLLLHRKPAPAVITVSADETATVIRTVDGDTFVARVGDREEKIRMIGIDTPETVDPRKPLQCFGKEASHRLHELLTGATVHLQPDPTDSDRDKYGRMLRYVSLQDGTDVNGAMIQDGYAFAYTVFPFQRREAYLKLQSEARAAARGLWAPTTCAGKHG